MKVQIDYQCMACGQMVKPVEDDDGMMGCSECGAIGEGFEEIPTNMTVEAIVTRIQLMDVTADAIDAQYKKVLEGLKKEKERAAKRRDNFIAWMKPVLEAYFHAHTPKGKKSLKIAGTQIGFKTVGGAWEINGDAATSGNLKDLGTLHVVLKWAMENRPDLVKQEVSLKWGDMKKLLNEKGAEAGVPGVTLTKEREEFYVR